jgi:hypothetical protein
MTIRIDWKSRARRPEQTRRYLQSAHHQRGGVRRAETWRFGDADLRKPPAEQWPDGGFTEIAERNVLVARRD